MLTRKCADSLGKHVVTLDQLKKAKERYTDQFQLDFSELFKVWCEEEENRAKGIQGFIPEAKPKKQKVSQARRYRDRIEAYMSKTAKVKREPLTINKPYKDKSDPEDVGAKINQFPKSDVVRMVEHKQIQFVKGASEINEYIRSTFTENTLINKAK